MMACKKQISILAMAVAMTLAMGSEANAVTFPFLNPGVTPPQDVIAANLDEITPQNTVIVVHNVPQVVPPTLTQSQLPNPTSASFGVETAFKDPNMSQAVPDCPPPPTPGNSCGSGAVKWSGWDHVSGGVCSGGGTGGWLVTPAPYCPPPTLPSTTSPTQTGSLSVATSTYTVNISYYGCTYGAGSCTASRTVTNSGGSQIYADSIALAGSYSGSKEYFNGTAAELSCTSGTCVGTSNITDFEQIASGGGGQGVVAATTGYGTVGVATNTYGAAGGTTFDQGASNVGTRVSTTPTNAGVR
jgi:hypothetical protein